MSRRDERNNFELPPPHILRKQLENGGRCGRLFSVTAPAARTHARSGGCPHDTRARAREAHERTKQLAEVKAE
jgi:hypothetical protein